MRVAVNEVIIAGHYTFPFTEHLVELVRLTAWVSPPLLST